MPQHEQSHGVRKRRGIFEDQKIILHSWTKRYVGAWLAKKPEFGVKLLRALQTTLICFAGSREPRKRMGQDSPPVFRDPQNDFSIA